MKRSVLTSSRVASIPQRVDQWETNLSPTNFTLNLEATISLVNNMKDPIVGLSLMMGKIGQIQNQAFAEVMISIFDGLATLCQNMVVDNLKRVLSDQNPSIYFPESLSKQIQQKNIYKASMSLLNLINRKKQERQKLQGFIRIKSKSQQDQRFQPETEDNSQLMKFFEGVRRYQNHQDKLGQQAIQKLRMFKDFCLRKQAIVRGFQLNKLQSRLNNIFNRNKQLFFNYHKRSQKLTQFIKISKNYEFNLIKSSFNQIINVLKRKTIPQLIESYRDLNLRKQLVQVSKQLKSYKFKKTNQKSSLRKLNLLFNSKQGAYRNILFEYLKSLPKTKYEKLAKFFIKASNTFMVYQKRRFFKKSIALLNNRTNTFIGKIKAIFAKRIQHSLFKMESYLLDIKRPVLSDRAKGKIVASVIRVKHDEVNLRKSFLKWWVKTKPSAVENKFMHMFLYAPTKPFTYFLRLKNMVKQNRIKKISAKTKYFVLFMKQKIQKVLKHNQQLIQDSWKTLLQLNDHFNYQKRLKTRMFNVLAGTGIGKVLKSIDIWKKLPDNKEIKKRQMMIASINKALSRMRKEVKNSFEAIKQNYFIGQEKKRSAALIMMRTAGGSVQQSFKKWQDSMRISKTISRCKAISSFLQQTTVATMSQYAVIFENPRQAYLRQKYLGRLINTQTGNLRKYFKILEEALKVARINAKFKDKQKQKLIERINNMLKNQSATGVKGVLQKLYINYKVKQKQINFIKRLMQTKGGKIYQAVRTWKDLPEKNQFSKVRNGSRFFSTLKKVADRTMIQVFKAFIDDYEMGQVRKRGAMGVLLSMTSSDVRKYFTKWHSDTKKRTTLAQCKTTMSFFESINNINHGNFLIIFESQRASKIKQKAFMRMKQNLGGGLRTYLLNWMKIAKQITMSKKINGLQRKHYVTIITNGISNKKSDLLKLSIASLAKNMRMKRIAKAFFTKLLDTQFGKVMKAVQAWHSIPSKQLNLKKQKAIKFQKRLQDLAQKGIRYSYSLFKSEQLLGQSKQKYILNKLLKRCMGIQQRKYIHWKQITKQLVLLEKARLLNKSFENIFSVIAIPWKQNLIVSTKNQVNLKDKIVTKLVHNNVSAMQTAFTTWKQVYTNNKNSDKYHTLSRLVQIWSGRRIKQQVFVSIYQQKQLQTQRTYINSLWRWKTSQFQAQYYNKFIQMFNQSQVLLSFSKIFNSKLHSVYSWAFGKLKLVKHSEQFKYNFIRKYFLKKLGSYFERFKQQVKGREIYKWKGKFQSSIRGMFMLQALQKAIKKIQSYQLRKWNKMTKKYFKGKQILERLAGFVIQQKQLAIKQLKINNKKSKLISGCNILTNYQHTLKSCGFKQLVKNSRAIKLINILNSTVKKTQKQCIDNLKGYGAEKYSRQQGLKKLSVLILKKIKQKQTQFLRATKKKAGLVFLLSTLFDIMNQKRRKQLKTTLKLLHFNKQTSRKQQSAQIIIKASQKYYKYVTGKTIAHWRKVIRDSVWFKKSVQMIATKPSIKSSLAISLWRMKVYTQKQNPIVQQ